MRTPACQRAGDEVDSAKIARREALAVIGVAIVILARCIDIDEAYRSLDGRILIIIVGMLALGRSMVDTGAVALIINAVVSLLIARRS